MRSAKSLPGGSVHDDSTSGLYALLPALGFIVEGRIHPNVDILLAAQQTGQGMGGVTASAYRDDHRLVCIFIS
jgi:hypothetical protein